MKQHHRAFRMPRNNPRQRSRNVVRLRCGLLALAVAPLGMAPAVATTLTYRLTDVGSLGVHSIGTDVNERGDVVGMSELSLGLEHAFLYRHGVLRDLGTLYGGRSGAQAINSAGVIAGWSARPAGLQFTSFLYSRGEMHDIGALAGGSSQALDINDAGQVTGTSASGAPDTYRAFLYDNGTMIDIGTLGGTSSHGYALNNRGQVTGQSQVAGDGSSHAFVYSRGTMTDLGTLGGMSSYGTAINDLGQVVGNSEILGLVHAFLYSDGKMTDLGTLGGRYSFAYDINNSGHVVGHSHDEALGQAFLFRDGKLSDLNEFIDPRDPFEPYVRLAIGRAINNRGQIVADGFDSRLGTQRVYLLTPWSMSTSVPEPSTLALVAIGLISLRVSRRRRAH